VKLLFDLSTSKKKTPPTVYTLFFSLFVSIAKLKNGVRFHPGKGFTAQKILQTLFQMKH